MTPTADIRTLTPDDAPAYGAMRLAAAADPSFGSTPESEATWSAPLLRQLLQASGRGFILGAFEADHLIGMVGFGHGLEEDEGTLYGLFVTPSRRRLAIGAGLVTALVKRARETGHRRIHLRVATTNSVAIRLYQREGFTLAYTEGSECRMTLTAA